MIKIIPATKRIDFECISKLAHIIWHEHYISIISLEQIGYMLEKFNSVKDAEERVKVGVLFFCLTYNDIPVGYTAVKKEDDFLFISKLYVLKAYRGKGIAKSTLQFIESIASSFSLSKMKLHVNKYNATSILVYEKTGFVNVGSLVTDIGNGFVMDDYVMEKMVS